MEILSPNDSAKPFAAPTESLAGLGPEAAAVLIAAAADVAVVVDRHGVVKDVALGSEDLGREGYAAWVGRPWVETVTVESRPKIEDLLREASPSSVSRLRQVNHPSPRGADVPVRYSTMRLAPDGDVVAIGRDLRVMASLQQRLADAQQSMEREYARIRGAETRYRLLFQLASEPVLIVEASSQRIIDANPAANQMIGRSAKRVIGQPFAELFAPESREQVQSMLAAVRVTGRVDDVHATLAGGPEFGLTASMFRQESASHFLVRLTPVAGPPSTAGKLGRGVMQVVERLPEGFVVTDPEMRILTANAAFLDMAQLATEEQVRGESLGRWLGRPGIDMDVLSANLREHGSVRLFSTVLRGEFGTTEDVEVAGVSVSSGDSPCLGFTIRGASLRTGGPLAGRELPRSVEQFTELVGRVSLKNLVRETTDMIERLCIEAALELTRDNRASAAEMLGLSRQSLYSKLRRYGLGDLDGDGEGN
ncbi:transcriptional regulator PpsR [Alsobacter sp. R-9]